MKTLTPVEAILLQVKEMAVLPHVVFKVIEISGSDGVSAAELDRIITVDPGFSSKVLMLANSASSGLPKKVTAIRDAVMYLGTAGVRSIALTAGVFDLFVGKTDKESLRHREWWKHSVESAHLCKWLAKRAKVIPDEAYTCGLLHWIGKPLLARFGGAGKYELVSQLEALGAPDFQAEQRVLGCHHGEVSAAVCAQWGFPASLVAGINYLSPSTDETRALAATTAIGGRLARFLHSESEPTFPHWATELLAIEDSEVKTLLKDGKTIVEAAQLSL